MRFQKIDRSDGLSYNSVLCVIQDHEHFLWIGTRDGLNKYNSLDNIIFKHDINDSSSLSNSHINCVYETHDHNIWVGTAKGLNKYNRGDNNFIQYTGSNNSRGLSNEYIKCISEDNEGYLWIGTSYGLNHYNPKEQSFNKLFLSQDTLEVNNIITLFHDKQNNLWVGTAQGLFIKKGNSFKSIDFAQESHSFEIRDIKQGNDGSMWVATEHHGAYRFNYNSRIVQNSFAYSMKQGGLVSNAVRNILVEDGQVWLATLKGLAIIESDNNITNITHSDDHPLGISSSSIHDIIKDHLGGYWLATYTGGLNYYHSQNNLFPHIENVIPIETSASNDFVPLLSNIWVLKRPGILGQWSATENAFTFYNSGGLGNVSSNIVKSISVDKQGNYWLGTYNGLNFFNAKTQKFSSYFHDEGNSNSLNENQVHAVHIDKNNLLWIGMNGGEFQTFNAENQKFEELANIGKIVNSIFEDSQGRIWIGERYGLKCLDRDSRQAIDISDVIKDVKDQLYYINTMSEDSDGRIWIGTQSSGIIIIDKYDKVYWFNKSNGLNDNTVNGILEDEQGYFWVSSNNGIAKLKFSPDKAENEQIETTNYTTAHGLQGKQFEKGSAIKTPNGKLIFGGINGANIISPQQVDKLVFYPKIVLSEFKIHYESVSSGKEMVSRNIKLNEISNIELNYFERNIYLRFAGINFINAEATFYRYKLGSINKQWIDLGHQRSINFSYLPIGKHQLNIQASNDANIWGNDYKTIEINVLPPWWRTWWAYLIYGLFIASLLYFFFYLSQRWATLKNSLAMEHFKHEQELELQESKLRFFTDVSHDLRTPLTLILAPLERIAIKKDISEELSRQLELIRRNGNRMMQLINQVLNLRKLETGHDKLQAAKGDIVPFLKEISLAFNEIASTQEIEFDYIPELPILSVYYDRDKMESVIFNLLSNAFKNVSPNGSITLTLRKVSTEMDKSFPLFKSVNEYAEIRVSNKGKVIPKEDLKHIFERFYTKKGNKKSGLFSTGVGLELTHRMVQLHHGDIKVESKALSDSDEGLTSFIVQIPIGKKHLSKEEIIANFKNSENASLYTQSLHLREKYTPIDHVVPDDSEVKQTDSEKQSLLIVEDNDEVRQFVVGLFSDNYNVTQAENGLIGWEKASQLLPDLIISDVMMPEMDGIKLCHKLKTDVRTSHVPVILLTARTTTAFKHEGIETGADEYITKPFSAEFLLLRVQNLIQKKELLRSYFMRQSILEPKQVQLESLDDRLLKKAVDYITEHIEDSNLSVEALSKEIGLSRVHFYRKIKALTNLTAVDFIRSIRLKKAALLLEQNKLSIKEIQYMVGFENADYFRKCFKAQYEIPPSAYAEKFQNDSNKY